MIMDFYVALFNLPKFRDVKLGRRTYCDWIRGIICINTSGGNIVEKLAHEHLHLCLSFPVTRYLDDLLHKHASKCAQIGARDCVGECLLCDGFWEGRKWKR